MCTSHKISLSDELFEYSLIIKRSPRFYWFHTVQWSWLISRCLYLRAAVVFSLILIWQNFFTVISCICWIRKCPIYGWSLSSQSWRQRLKSPLLRMDEWVIAGGLNWHLRCYLVSSVTSNQPLSGPTAPSFTLLQQLLSTQLVFMSNVRWGDLGLCVLHASKPVEKWHSCWRMPVWLLESAYEVSCAAKWKGTITACERSSCSPWLSHSVGRRIIKAVRGSATVSHQIGRVIQQITNMQGHGIQRYDLTHW